MYNGKVIKMTIAAAQPEERGEALGDKLTLDSAQVGIVEVIVIANSAPRHLGIDCSTTTTTSMIGNIDHSGGTVTAFTVGPDNPSLYLQTPAPGARLTLMVDGSNCYVMGETKQQAVSNS
jgi:hypothetical protein